MLRLEICKNILKIHNLTTILDTILNLKIGEKMFLIMLRLKGIILILITIKDGENKSIWDLILKNKIIDKNKDFSPWRTKRKWWKEWKKWKDGTKFNLINSLIWPKTLNIEGNGDNINRWNIIIKTWLRETILDMKIIGEEILLVNSKIGKKETIISPSIKAKLQGLMIREEMVQIQKESLNTWEKRKMKLPSL